MNKRLLIVLIIIVVLAIVIGFVCFNKNKVNTPSKTNTDTSSVETNDEEYIGGVREVKNGKTEFDEELGFSIEKGNELKNVKYDTIFLHGDDQVQLDLILDDNGKIGTLVVSKTDDSSSEVGENLLIAETTVLKITGIDGIDNYLWEKEGFYYRFATKNDSGVTNDDIAKIIIGYNVKVAEENIEE